MATIRLPPDFKEFLRLLNLENAEYLLIGGYAVIYHGYPRTTGDIDIWIALNRENAEKVATVLRDFGFDVPDADIFLEEDRIIRLGMPPFRIEVLTTISGVSFESCYEQRVLDVIDDVEVNIIDLEHLKENKKASGRAKDMNDLENLP